LDAGADDYVSKPFPSPVLLARLRSLLRRGAAERPAVLTAGDLRLDPAAKRDLEVMLTVRGLALLEFLLRRFGAHSRLALSSWACGTSVAQASRAAVLGALVGTDHRGRDAADLPYDC
jgi:DNA-binding response OmpR family regulator